MQNKSSRASSPRILLLWETFRKKPPTGKKLFLERRLWCTKRWRGRRLKSWKRTKRHEVPSTNHSSKRSRKTNRENNSNERLMKAPEREKHPRDNPRPRPSDPWRRSVHKGPTLPGKKTSRRDKIKSNSVASKSRENTKRMLLVKREKRHLSNSPKPDALCLTWLHRMLTRPKRMDKGSKSNSNGTSRDRSKSNRRLPAKRLSNSPRPNALSQTWPHKRPTLLKRTDKLHKTSSKSNRNLQSNPRSLPGPKGRWQRLNRR